ncbi:MAG TPA: integrase core domain-containing protein [Gemmatimonadales bacterium]|nr:integrase core domain-containing protein [Gemmatimonadales bacterium]
MGKLIRIAGPALSGLGVVITTFQPALAGKPAVPRPEPKVGEIAERFVRTARSECLDWLLILNAGHLERALTVFIDHCNGWRPHRSLGLVPPNGRTSVTTWTPTATDSAQPS